MSQKSRVEIGDLVFGGTDRPGLVIDSRDTEFGPEILVLYQGGRTQWEAEDWHRHKRKRMAAGTWPRSRAEQMKEYLDMQTIPVLDSMEDS